VSGRSHHQANELSAHAALAQCNDLRCCQLALMPSNHAKMIWVQAFSTLANHVWRSRRIGASALGDEQRGRIHEIPVVALDSEMRSVLLQALSMSGNESGTPMGSVHRDPEIDLHIPRAVAGGDYLPDVLCPRLVLLINTIVLQAFPTQLRIKLSCSCGLMPIAFSALVDTIAMTK